MKVDQLQLIERNDTVNGILSILCNSFEPLFEVNSDIFKRNLRNKGIVVNLDCYFKFFKDLESLEVGVFEHNSKVFISKFSLKDIADQILQPNKLINIRDRESCMSPKAPGFKVKPVLAAPVSASQPSADNKPHTKGRPKGAKNKPKPLIPIADKSSNKEIYIVFTTEKGLMVPLSLKDAEKIAKEVQQIKEQLL